MTLATNVELTDDAVLTVSGLTGSSTPSTSSLPISQHAPTGTSVLRVSGVWNQELGSLAVGLAANASFAPGVMLRFSFELQNSVTGQESPAAWVQMGARGRDVIPAMAMAQGSCWLPPRPPLD